MIAFVIVPVATAVVFGEVVAGRRCLRRIEQWAAVNHFQVESVERLWVSTGAWGVWRAAGGRSRRYFNVTITDEAGSTRSGTAKIYGGIGGLVADLIDVRWR